VGAISLAGGISDFGSNKVKIIRKAAEKRKIIWVNLNELLEKGKMDCSNVNVDMKIIQIEMVV
jgi:hypothetical protein